MVLQLRNLTLDSTLGQGLAGDVQVELKFDYNGPTVPVRLALLLLQLQGY